MRLMVTGGGATQIAAKGLWAARILNTFEQNQNPQVGQVAQPRVFIIISGVADFCDGESVKFVDLFCIYFVFILYLFCIYFVFISFVKIVCLFLKSIYFVVFILYLFCIYCLYIDKNTK